jgi:hypothetical protein
MEGCFEENLSLSGEKTLAICMALASLLDSFCSHFIGVDGLDSLVVSRAGQSFREKMGQ